MMDGDWQVVPQQVLPADPDEKGFVPAGTRLRLRISGPSDAMVRRGNTDQLSIGVTFLPPFPGDLCHAPAVAKACAGGQPTTPIELDDGVLTVETLTAKAAANPLNAAFVDAGARPGARMASIDIGDGVEWQLWLRSRDEMIGQYLALQGGRNTVVRTVWTRVGHVGITRSH